MPQGQARCDTDGIKEATGHGGDDKGDVLCCNLGFLGLILHPVLEFL